MKVFKEFPFNIALNKYRAKMVDHGLIANKEAILQKKYHDLLNYLKESYSDVLMDVKKNYTPQYHDTKIIWTMWYQGVDKAPDSVRLCLKSMKKNIPSNYQIIILDRNNINEYIDIPENIAQKVEKGFVSLTHFSDFIRARLLEKWGGQWIDSTILFTHSVEESFFTGDFYSVKTSESMDGMQNGLWTSFCIGGCNSLLFKYIDSLWVAYFEDHDIIIDYFLFDYFIKLAIDYDKRVYQMVTASHHPEKNKKIFQLLPCLMDDNQIVQIDSFLQDKDTFMYKLSYKETFINTSGESYKYLKQYMETKHEIN